MPHDKHSRPIKPGDLVYVPCVVKTINENEGHCNVNVETFHPLYPTEHKTQIVLNSRQVELVAESSDAEEAGVALFGEPAHADD